jgi:hypothetical protein
MCRTPEIVTTTRSRPFTSEPATSGHCVNCGRAAHRCPACDTFRCDSDIHFSIMGQVPLACVVCQPAGIRSWVGPSSSMPGMAEIGWVPAGQPTPWELP